MDVLKKINKMRLDRGWSVYRLSVESGIAQSTLTNMFNRETQPSITTLQLICDAFGITLADFFREDASRPAGKEWEATLQEMEQLNEQDRRLVYELVCRLNQSRRK